MKNVTCTSIYTSQYPFWEKEKNRDTNMIWWKEKGKEKIGLECVLELRKSKI
jgi:hypothetical protein